MLPEKFDLDQYKAILLRRTWFVVIPFFFIVMAGSLYALTSPKLYKASTLILVQRQKVPETYVRSTVTDTLGDRIKTIEQQVMSRTNLESLINIFELYANKSPSKSDMLMFDKVALMRSRIEVYVARGAAFSISFTSSNPDQAMKVTNALATNFIDENLRLREQYSVGTTSFLENELKRIEGILADKELALTDYKRQYMGGLPDQLETNIALLGQLNAKIESITRRIDETRTQKAMLHGQIANMKETTHSASMDQWFDSGSGDEIAAAPEVDDLKERLRSLLLRYTENHPDVVKLKRTIASIEEEQHQEPPSPEDRTFSEYANSPGGDNFLDIQLQTLEFQMAAIEQTLRDQQIEKTKLDKEVSRLQKVIADTPKRQLDLISLQRDYDAIQDQYQSLLTKKLDSQLATNLEKRQKGEQFAVIDPAKLPEKPFSPNVARIILLAALAGLAAGCGLALGMEYLDKSFRNYDEISEFLQLPVLAVIPRIETADDIRKKKRFKMFAYWLSGCLLVAAGVGVWLWMHGDLQEWVEKVRTLV